MRWQFDQLGKKRLQAQLTKLDPGLPPKGSPDELLGELFHEVQVKRIHDDSKVFVDLVPASRLRKILRAYQQQRQRPNFNLSLFVEKYFQPYLAQADVGYRSNPENSPQQHIHELWDLLTRETFSNTGSLIALPYPYVVPGGRYSEQFYWDSYFIMLGLAADDRYDLLEGMIKNYAFMIRKIGYIPTANRTYLLSRSQPPFFSHMLRLLAKKRGKAVLVRYLPYLLTTYRFWMKGTKDLNHTDKRATRRVVLLPDKSILNRYYDSKRTPRPESYKEDVETAEQERDRSASQVYLDLRAAAESGWDFSSRWFKDKNHLHTIHTTDMLPVDLNCLLVDLERTIADIYDLLKQGRLAARYRAQAQERADAINRYCWSSDDNFYFDYDFEAEDYTHEYTLAAVFPLYSRVASNEQAAAVARKLWDQFLKPGGLITTLRTTAEQWDAPNGWAPLQWMAIQGLRNYGYLELANEIKKRWVSTNLALYRTHGKLVEKYNVVDNNASGGGGEYPLQDGFGWTNGVLLALLKEDERSRE